MPPRPATRLALLLLLASTALLAAGCGGSDDDGGERIGASPEFAAVTASVVASTALGSFRDEPEPDAVPHAVAAREVLAAARDGERATRTFTTSLTVEVPDAPEVTIELAGTARHASSSATATPSGLAAALLEEHHLAVRDNRLLAAPAESDPAWLDLGSASGVQLDVGRELLTHPMLTRVTSASRSTDGELVVRVTVPPADLRDYAADEREGPVTDLLTQATGLTMTAVVQDGFVTSDSFELTLGGGGSGDATVVRGRTTTSHGEGIDDTPLFELPPPGADLPAGSVDDLLPTDLLAIS